MDINSWINLAVAIGTFAAVVVALFGDVWRKKWFAPKLSAKLLSQEGELNCMTNGVAARYYHLLIKNSSQEIATNTTVMLTKLQEKWGGGIREIWNGRVPMTWRNGMMFPSMYKSVGPEEHCDLIAVTENGKAFFELYYFPNNLKHEWNSAFDIVVSFQIESMQCTSEEYNLEIVWDGKWENGNAEMAKHISIKEV